MPKSLRVVFALYLLGALAEKANIQPTVGTER